MTAVPDVNGSGVGSLTVDTVNNFSVFEEFTTLTCPEDGSACTASVGTERIWDTQLSGNGHLIKTGEGQERAFAFVGWYAVYGPECATTKPSGGEASSGGNEGAGESGETEGDGAARRLSIAAEGNACWIKGQTTEPVIFVLGALSGVAAASLAILSSMLF